MKVIVQISAEAGVTLKNKKLKKKKNKDRQLLAASLIVIDFTIWFRVGLFVGNIFFS